MAASFNKVLLMGNLTRDPELRYIPSGTAVSTFDLAVNRVYKAQSGEKKQETSFIRTVVWGRRAEVCAEYLKKGSSVFVEGRLRSRSWEGKDGQKRNTIEVIANNVQFLTRAPKDRALSQPAPTETQDATPDEGIESINLDTNSSKGATEDEIPF